jgi:membrane protein DedA with SNARE-associated domain
MRDSAEAVLSWLVAIPDALLYLLIGFAAAIENLIPPFPGDVVVVIGGVIAGAGDADPTILFLVVWLANAGTALLVYALGRRYGAGFFQGRLGSFLLAPAQVDTLSIAYRRFGVPIIFFSRFLPIFRPIVPVFAGVAQLGFWKTAIPILAASAIWYGFLVYLGAFTGQNWQAVVRLLDRIGGWLWAAAIFLLLAFVWWWWRSRRVIEETERTL